MTKLNKTDFTFLARRGLRANVDKEPANYNHDGIPVGEIRFTTDTENLFIVVSSGGVAAIQTLDMAVVDEEFKVVIDEEFQIVYDY